MFALVDGNAFYASCEQVFDPKLRRRPLVVLSNNDGCAIARTDQAKALGVKMGQPAHELRELQRNQGLVLRSANFALYGDMSRRMTEILRDAAPRIEVYSIDESFLDLTGVPDRMAFAQALRERVGRWIGIPNCIGMGPTKTLAKLANRIAKRGAGVVDLSEHELRATMLATFPIQDVWGVGAKWAAKLGQLGISTAAALRDAPGKLIQDQFGVVLRRTQCELQGFSCIALQEVEPDRQQIMVSRSFADRVTDHQAVAEALATFAERACEKLRARGLVAGAIGISAGTDTFRPELPQHYPGCAIALVQATSDTSVVLRAIRQMLAKFLRLGYAYKRAGIVLLDLARPSALQGDLFEPVPAGNPALMVTLDAINRRFGRGVAGFGASGWRAQPAWGMRQKCLSPHYTTRPADFPRALC